MRDGNVREDGAAKRRERELRVWAIVEGVVGVYFERVVVALGVGDAKIMKSKVKRMKDALAR